MVFSQSHVFRTEVHHTVKVRDREMALDPKANILYVCSHQMSRRQEKYNKKHADWQCKIDSKKIGCHCQLVIKHYPHTLTILGHYADKHNYKI